MKNKEKKGNIIKAIVAGVVSIIAVAGLMVGAMALNRTVTTVELTASDYKVATLGEDGKAKTSEAQLVTKDFIPTEDLKGKIGEDAEISYRVFFYNKDKEFISATEELRTDFDESAIPEDAEYAKFVIIPIDDEEIDAFEKGGYVSMLEVSHAR